MYMILNIDPNWNYKDTVLNLRALKNRYYDSLRSFSYFELHDKVLFTYEIKNAIYSLNFEEWKKDRIWEYLNHDIPLTILQNLK